MGTILEYRIKNNYGRELMYPANEVAEAFCRLIEAKTLNEYTIKQIAQMGYEIKQVM